MQTSFSARPPVGFPGMPHDVGFTDDISCIVEQDGGIAPGLVVIRGTDRERQAKLPAATFAATEVLGITVRTHHARLDLSSTGTENYEDEASIPVRRKGRIWVEIEDAFEAGDPVYVRFTAPGTEQIGAIRTDADTANAVLVAGMRIVSSGAAGALGIVEVNL